MRVHTLDAVKIILLGSSLLSQSSGFSPNSAFTNVSPKSSFCSFHSTKLSLYPEKKWEFSGYVKRYTKLPGFHGLHGRHAQRIESLIVTAKSHDLRASEVSIDEIPSSQMNNDNNEKNKKNKEESDSLETQRSDAEMAFNALLLFSAFGFALYTILNIDHGMSRGWTHAEIIARVPFDNWQQYEDSLSEKPIFTKTTINVIVFLLGDWLSQTIFQKKDILEFDAMRTLKNGFVGMCLGPIAHQYYEFSDTILPPAVTVNRIYKICMDQTLYLSTNCSLYIAAVGLLGGQSLEDVKETIRTRLKSIMFTSWKFWPLVHCVTYGVIPARHRVLWVQSVNLIWNAILAKAVNDDDAEEVMDNVDQVDLDGSLLEVYTEDMNNANHVYLVQDSKDDSILHFETLDLTSEDFLFNDNESNEETTSLNAKEETVF